MLMSAFRPKRTSLAAPHMSAFGGKADIPIAPIILTFEVVSFEERHHCTGHRRDQLLIASVYCERLCLTDSNSSTRLHHFAPKYETSPFAGASRFVLNSTVSMVVSSGTSENAAYPHALSITVAMIPGMHETHVVCTLQRRASSVRFLRAADLEF
jgi:hypothetical protein